MSDALRAKHNQMKYLLIAMFWLVAFVQADAATYYIDYSAGADNNNGTSKSTPWKRAPGMKGFAASYQHVAGDRFIFKGGVTWPVGVFQMLITAGGSSDSNRDWYTVDQTWFAGSSWARPIFDFQHTLLGAGWTQAAGVLVRASYITFQGLDVANHRAPWEGNGVGTWGSTSICLDNSSYVTISQCVIRDWDQPTPLPDGASGGGGVMRVNNGQNNLVTDCEFHQANVALKNGTCVWNIPVVRYSEFHNTPSAIFSAQLIHDNYFHDIPNPTDPQMHSNIMLCPGGLTAFNNVIHDVQNRAQVIYVSPGFGGPATDLIYNNVVWSTGQPCIALETDGINHQGAVARIFNNTLVGWAGGGLCIRVINRQNGNFPTLDIRNNHLISSTYPICYNYAAGNCGAVNTLTIQNNLIQTLPQAIAGGYTMANLFRPTSSSSPTVGLGQNLASFLSADRLGLARGVAWDIGAYQYAASSGGGGGGTPGTLALVTGSYSVSETAGSVSLTVRRSGGSTGSVSCNYASANGTATAGANFTAVSGTLVWNSGDTADKTIQVSILNASTTGGKSFSVALSGLAGGATLGSPASATVTIAGSGTTTPPPTGGTSLLVNSSFESGSTGWTLTGNQGVASTGFQPSDGSKLIAFNWGQTTPNGVLSQVFGTTVGQTYTLVFDVGVLAFNQDEQRLQVRVQGSSTLLSRTISVFGLGGGATKWVAQSFTFVADSTTATLTFQDVSVATKDLDLLLDNVRLTTQSGSLSTTQPASLTVSPGDSAIFSVTATGPGTLTYQWRFNAVAIAGATSSSYTIGNVQPGQAGNYDVVVSNGTSSVTSSAATLTVVQAASFSNGGFEAGYAGWVQSGYQGVSGPPTYSPSEGVKLVVFNWGQMPPNGLLAQTFTTIPGQTYTLQFDMGVIAFNTSEQRLQVTAQGASRLLSKTVSLLGVGGGTTRWAAQSFTFVADSGSTVLSFQDVSPVTFNVDLLLDNVRLTSQVANAPTITSQPTGLTVNPGGSATFSVAATASGALTYQWRFNSTPISGATASSYSLSNVQSGQAGNYDVVVTSGGSSVISSAATLTVIAQAASGFVNGGFELGYTGWTQSGYQGISGAPAFVSSEGAKLAVFNWGQMTPNGVLSQTFSTTVGQTYALLFDLGVTAYNTLEQRMRVRVQGTSQLLSQTLSIFGAGGGTTRWIPQGFSFVANATSTTLIFEDLSTSTINIDVLLDNVRITPQGPTTTSITTQPASTSANAGQSVSFSVAATGPGTLTYQWRLNGTAISGATGSTYTINNVQAGNAGSYDVVVSSSSASPVTSTAATLSVVVAAPTSVAANGSFESSLTSWTSSGYLYAATAGTPFTAADGSKLVVFNGGEMPANGILSQSFSTTVGQQYVLTFNIGVFAYNFNQQRLQTTVQGGTTLVSQVASLSALANGVTRWAPVSYTFTANSTTTTLTFRDVSPTTAAVDLLLDNVRIMPGS